MRAPIEQCDSLGSIPQMMHALSNYWVMRRWQMAYQWLFEAVGDKALHCCCNCRGSGRLYSYPCTALQLSPEKLVSKITAGSHLYMLSSHGAWLLCLHGGMIA